MSRTVIEGAVPGLAAEVCVAGRTTYLSLASITSGTVKVQCRRGGAWTDDTGIEISAAGTVEIRPCAAWRLVAVTGTPVVTGGFLALGG